MPSTATTGRKPRILLWQDLNVEELHLIKKSTDKLEILAEIFGFSNYKNDLKSSILLDLYFYTIQFAEKKGFNDEETSALFSIVKNVHEKAVEIPFGNVDDTFKYFKELLLCHSVKRPPFSIQLYSTDQVQLIADYITNTYFKHYKLYKYAFTPKVRLNLNFEYTDIPETPQPEEEDEPSNEEKVEVPEEGGHIDVEIKETNIAEDSPAIKELKSLITETLNEQVNQLHQSVDEQLRASDEMLSEKFGFPCGRKEVAKSPSTQKRKGK